MPSVASDLAARLARRAGYLFNDGYQDTAQLMKAAAAELERLQATVNAAPFPAGTTESSVVQIIYAAVAAYRTGLVDGDKGIDTDVS